MLGSQIKSLVNDKLKQEENKIQRIKEQKDLKSFTKKIADCEPVFKNNDIESIEVCNKHEGGGFKSWNSYWIKDNSTEIIEVCNKHEGGRLKSFKDWLKYNDTESIEVCNEHEGGGFKPWNSYWLKDNSTEIIEVCDEHDSGGLKSFKDWLKYNDTESIELRN